MSTICEDLTDEGLKDAAHRFLRLAAEVIAEIKMLPDDMATPETMNPDHLYPVALMIAMTHGCAYIHCIIDETNP